MFENASLNAAPVAMQSEGIANATVYDVGFCLTSEGEEGISIDMYLADSSAIRLETLCQSIRSLKPLIEGKAHRITVRADSLHFRPLVGSVPANNFGSH